MFEDILSFFGGLLGLVVGTIAAILIWWLLSYLFWGLVWLRILTKAGFRGDRKRLLYRLIYWPTLFSPFWVILLGLTNSNEAFAIVLVLSYLCQWGAIYYLILAPWPVATGKPPKEEMTKTE